MPIIDRNDAIDTIFLAQELESVTKEVYTKYPEAKYSQLIPVDSSDDEGAESVGYIMYDEVGSSAIVSAGSTDSPSVDAFAKKFTLKVHELGNHFGYDMRELRNESKAGRSIRARRMSTSARAIEQHHDDIAILGDGTNDKRYGGMYGIVFHPNVTKIASPKLFSIATDAEIMKYFSDIVTKMLTDTKEMYQVNTIAMDGTVKAELQGRVVANTNVTLWSQIVATYPDITFDTHYRLKDVGKNPSTLAVTPTRCMIAYHKSPDVLNYKQPMPYKTYSPVNLGRSVRIETASTSAGVEVIQPLAVIIYHTF